MLQHTVEDILYRHGIVCTAMNIVILVGEVESVSQEAIGVAFGQYIEDSGRFLQ